MAKINIRRYLIADPGCLLCNFDLSMAEARIISMVAPEPRMQRAFNEKKDIYRDAACGIFKVPYEKTSKETREGAKLRKKGKISVLGFNYHLMEQAFALQNNITYEEARKLRKGYLETYPGIPAYWKRVQEAIKSNKPLQTCSMGKDEEPRHRYFLGPKTNETFQDAYAWPMQATVGKIINKRAIEFIYFNQQWFSDVYKIAQEHDGFRWQVSLDIGWQKLVDIAKRMRDELEKPVYWKGQPFTIPADFSFGLNVRDMVEIKEKETFCDLDSPQAAERLEEIYNECIYMV